jgi:hypothetical protein
MPVSILPILRRRSATLSRRRAVCSFPAKISEKADRDFEGLTVPDDGCGIPEARREEALRRGKRLDVSGSGTGLGLAIVADIADACGATLTFHEQAIGFSTTLRIRRAVAQETKRITTDPIPRSDTELVNLKLDNRPGHDGGEIIKGH